MFYSCKGLWEIFSSSCNENEKNQTKVFKLNFNGGDFFSILVEQGVSAMKKILKISIEIFFKAKKSMLF